jgi:hypothetical protein
MVDTDERYFHTQNTCHGHSCPVQDGFFETVVISPSGKNMADIFNGFIYGEMESSFDIGEAVIPKITGP